MDIIGVIHYKDIEDSHKYLQVEIKVYDSNQDNLKQMVENLLKSLPNFTFINLISVKESKNPVIPPNDLLPHEEAYEINEVTEFTFFSNFKTVKPQDSVRTIRGFYGDVNQSSVQFLIYNEELANAFLKVTEPIVEPIIRTI